MPTPARQFAIGAAATVASVSTVAYLLHRHVFPQISIADPALPPRWHPFDHGSADIVFQDRLRYCEDVLVDHEKEMAIISCDPGRAQWNTVMGTMYDPNPRGTLYLYKYTSNTRDLLSIRLIDFPSQADFHPLGINFYRAKDAGITRLFVVNHQRRGSTVDIFDLDYERGQAVFITSISDGNHTILSPNAISPVSYTAFYVTNDHRFIPRLYPWLNFQETSRALPLGWLTFVDFAVQKPQFSIAATGIPFANGVVVTPTGKEVIVAATSGMALHVYDRNPDTNKLSACREKIPVTFRPDNLSFDESLESEDRTAFEENGNFLRGLICAGHPSPRRIVAMSRDPKNNRAPSWVVEVRRSAAKGESSDSAPCPASLPGRDSRYHLRTLYQSDGTHYPTSTTGAIDSKRRRLIISGLYAHGLLDISWPAKDNIDS